MSGYVKSILFKRLILGVVLSFSFGIINPIDKIYAQEISLPIPGTRVSISPVFNPPILKGIKVHPDNPFRFEFILDQGDKFSFEAERESIPAKKNFLKSESSKLIKYFLASLTIPAEDLWVNLSPYEKNRITPEKFGQTEMGRDLLAQDYMLKQITASLIDPEGEIGKQFWKRVYEESFNKFGTTNIAVNTFNKVWIVPEKAVVYENAKAATAYVVESKLKVMLEEDYLAKERNTPAVSLRKQGAGASQVVRDIILPELEKEINQGKNFAQLRQVYNSLILATWYKQKIKDSILNQVYSDKNKTSSLAPYPLTLNPQQIYQRYLQAFKKGVFNYIKETQMPNGQAVPRRYFSGGFALGNMAMVIDTKVGDKAMANLLSSSNQLPKDLRMIHIQLNPAMAVDSVTKRIMLDALRDRTWPFKDKTLAETAEYFDILVDDARNFYAKNNIVARQDESGGSGRSSRPKSSGNPENVNHKKDYRYNQFERAVERRSRFDQWVKRSENFKKYDKEEIINLTEKFDMSNAEIWEILHSLNLIKTKLGPREIKNQERKASRESLDAWLLGKNQKDFSPEEVNELSKLYDLPKSNVVLVLTSRYRRILSKPPEPNLQDMSGLKAWINKEKPENSRVLRYFSYDELELISNRYHIPKTRISSIAKDKGIRFRPKPSHNLAMIPSNGGIDLTANRMDVRTNHVLDKFDFKINQDLERQWQDSLGVELNIVGIEPINDLFAFLGVPRLGN